MGYVKRSRQRCSSCSTTGLAYGKEGTDVKSDPGGADGLAEVPLDLEESATEAAEECPGECIFIES
jgi:ferredoxin